MMNFNNKVVEVAGIKKLSQNELSRKTNLSLGLINAIFQGQKTLDNISYNTLMKLAEGLGVSIKYLVDENNDLSDEVLSRFPDDIRHFITDFKVSLPWLNFAYRANVRHVKLGFLETIVEGIESHRADKISDNKVV